MKKRRVSFVAALALVACGVQPLTVSLMDFQDGLARFSVGNRSGLAVRSASFIVLYEVAGENRLRADTVRYELTRGQPGDVPFVGSGDETFFLHQLPEGASTPTAEVLSVDYSDGTSWERGRAST